MVNNFCTVLIWKPHWRLFICHLFRFHWLNLCFWFSVLVSCCLKEKTKKKPLLPKRSKWLTLCVLLAYSMTCLCNGEYNAGNRPLNVYDKGEALAIFFFFKGLQYLLCFSLTNTRKINHISKTNRDPGCLIAVALIGDAVIVLLLPLMRSGGVQSNIHHWGSSVAPEPITQKALC